MADEPTIAEPIIAAGVLTAVHSETNPKLAELLELAMAKAVEQALADGVSIFDSEKILGYKKAAYAYVMEQTGNG